MLALLGSSVASAQTSQNTVVQATATVTAAFAVNTANNLAFGNVIQGASATTILASASGAGRVNIVGSNSAGITVTATSLPSTLVNGVNSLNIGSYQYCYVQSTALQTSCSPTAIVTGGFTSGATLSSTGTGFFYIGATLAIIPVGAVVGNYSGNIQINVTTP